MQPNCPSCIEYPSWIKSTKLPYWTCTATFHYKLEVAGMRARPSKSGKFGLQFPWLQLLLLYHLPLNPHPWPLSEFIVSSYREKVKHRLCLQMNQRDMQARSGCPSPLHHTPGWFWRAVMKEITLVGRTSSGTSGHPLPAEGEVAWETNL